MKISSAGELYNFVVNNGLISISQELSVLVVCIDEYGRMCNCDSESSRLGKLNQCKSIYECFLSRVTRLKQILLSKTPDPYISFYVDGRHIVTINR